MPFGFYGWILWCRLFPGDRTLGHPLITNKASEGKLPPVSLSDDSKVHIDNWIDCMRARDPNTNGNIHRGFWHSVGACMATRAYREGRKLYWDRQREEIVDHPLL